MSRIVLGYSGDVRTSVAIPWLRETQRAEVIAVLIDLGQAQELEAIRDRALAAGAARAHVLDVRDAFAQDFVVPALQAGALQTPSAMSALARPMIAKMLVEIAAIEQAGTIAHGARAGSRALATAISMLDPAASVIAVANEWSMTPPEQVEYARLRNVLCVLADPDEGGPAPKSPAECPDEAAYVEVRFDRGAPVAINGIEMPLTDLLATLTTIAAAHGVVRPPAVLLHAAYSALRTLDAAPEGMHRSVAMVGREYLDLIEQGLWFSPLRRALDAFVGVAREGVSGVVRMKLFKGDVDASARHQPQPTRLTVVSQ